MGVERSVKSNRQSTGKLVGLKMLVWY